LFLTISEVLNHDFFADICPQKKDKDDNTMNIDTVFDVLKELVKEKIKDKG
jgi:hypothetical protein